MLKKMMLLAVAALATMAFAIPAIASADEGAIYDINTSMTLTEGEEIHFTGTAGFNSTPPGSGFNNCGITGNLTQLAGADEVHVHLEVVGGCDEGTGSFGGCHVEEATGTGEGTVTGHDIDIKNLVIVGTNDPKCGSAIGLPGALESVTLDFPEVTLQPAAGSNTSLDDLTVSGAGTATTAIGNLPIDASGTLTPTETETWAIETLP